MSYVRFSENSDVYVFDHSNGCLCCCGCALNPVSYYAETADEMVKHLLQHEAAGHEIPASVIEEIGSTANEDGDRAQRRRKGEHADDRR